MQLDGSTNPPINVKEYTELVVRKLNGIDPNEELEIDVSKHNEVKIIVLSTGEVLIKRVNYT